MKRKLVAIWLVVCMTFTLCACTSTDKPQTDSESGEVVIPKTEETTETADQLQIVELTDVDPIAVQEIPIYEDITLKNNEVIDILDISESAVFLAVNTESELEQGVPRTNALIIYEQDSRAATVVEILENSDLYVTAGRMVEKDYVYTAIASPSLPGGKGVVRRVGSSPWEFPFDADSIDGETLPEPFAMPSGDVVFILCGEQPDDNNAFRVVSVSPDGTATVIFTPENRAATGYTMMIPYQSGYMFRYASGSGYQFCVGDENSVSPFAAVSDCRAVYPWWICSDDTLLLALGFGDNVNGITSTRNAMVTKDGMISQLGDLQYTRFTLGNSGRIAAVNLDWEQYLLTFKNSALSAVRIDLPATATEFFRSNEGRLYAHLSNPRLGRVGLFEILE